MAPGAPHPPKPSAEQADALLELWNQLREDEAFWSPWRTLMALLYAAWALTLLALLLFPSWAQAQPQPQPPAAAARWRAELVRAAHTQWGLDAPVAALAAQVHQESGWNPQAVSAVGARGMAQFMPGTARWWCELNGLGAAQCQPHNPVWALRALVGYDKWLFDRTPLRYTARDRLWVALRAYNGGLGHWQAEALATGLAHPGREQVDAACGRARRHVSHCAENLAYPQRILQLLQPRYASWGGVL
ncbi:transglycosylase SLT domain-containing protein [Tibeticola sp.]|uniref:transglycosylase SLT domain-containing protein n=1 Tax=Tibeticola sp. TaxID=2005368 RepID=UPI0025F8D452|nr:transglycosylase SLT domain-containing protein [Tibeticola sp.]